MTVAFTNYNMLSGDSFAGQENITAGASATVYSGALTLSMWDSIHGVFFTIGGTRYGVLVTDVVVQIQQATMQDAATALWENVGAPVNFGAGGVIGAPATANISISAFPAAGQSFMPYMRLAFTTQANSGCVISKLFRSSRGR